jgi:hypothetical protein
MIDIISAALGVFCGGCIGFIAGKLSSVSAVDMLESENYQLGVRLEDAEEELLSLMVKEAMSKPKRGKGGRFVSKSKGEKG